jgi:TfoX/Sxy family transcriptional regulator of competence genes
MAFDERLAKRVHSYVVSRAEVSEKKMFGGLAYLSKGKMFCGIVGNDLMVRVGPDRYEECLARAHVRPMDFTGKPMKGYVFVARTGLRTAKALGRWIDMGLEFVEGLPRPPKRNTRAAKRATGSVDFGSTFESLKRLVKRHAGFLSAQTATGTEYILTGPMMARQKKELWFGGVKQGKAYVSLHLMPVYMFPDLLDGISPALRARMQGKSCFNFKHIEPQLLDEVDALIATSIQRLRTEGILPPTSTLTRPIHPMDDAVEATLKRRRLMSAYQSRPAYQQNDYLGWINRAKRPETKARRLGQMLDELERGDVYMGMAWRGPRAPKRGSR